MTEITSLKVVSQLPQGLEEGSDAADVLRGLRAMTYLPRSARCRTRSWVIERFESRPIRGVTFPPSAGHAANGLMVDVQSFDSPSGWSAPIGFGAFSAI